MDEFVKNVMDGTATEEQLTQFRDKLDEAGKKVLAEAQAFITKRQHEQGKVDTLSAEARQQEDRLNKLKTDADAEEARLNNKRTENSQLRTENIDSAKAKFFAEYGIKPEDQAQYDEEFNKLDSGKMTPELIYKDFEKAHVSLNSDAFIAAERAQRSLEQGAFEYTAGAAGAHAHATTDGEPPKFSPLAKKIATDSGITEEAASKIEKEGYARTIE